MRTIAYVRRWGTRHKNPSGAGMAVFKHQDGMYDRVYLSLGCNGA
jgi:hypothetical protein